jgi:hypothetical protein
MPPSIKFVGGPVNGANFPGSDQDYVGVPLDENLKHVSTGEPFALAGYKRETIDGEVRYRFFTIRRPNGQPFPTEFIGGPAAGLVPLTAPIQCGPEEIALPLTEDGKLLKNGGTVEAVAVYARRQADEKWQYHFVGIETSGAKLDEVRAETTKRRMKSAMGNFYRKPDYSVYKVPPTDRHRQIAIQLAERAANVDEMIAPLILETWRLGIETLGSCQELKSGQAYIEFPIADEGDVFHRILQQAGIACTAERKVCHIAYCPSGKDGPMEKFECEHLNVQFSSADIEQITFHLRGLKSAEGVSE